MTAVTDDLITALSESMQVAINRVLALKDRHTYIYTPAILDSISQATAIPHVFYYYAGLKPLGRSQLAVFGVLLYAKAETLTQIKGNTVMPVATAILQDLRKAIACERPSNNRDWDLLSEVPDLSQADYLVYRQLWETAVQIKN